MERGEKTNKFLGVSNNQIYLDLKDIIKENGLAFLPAKSLCRFKAICSAWGKKISTPFFAHRQSNSFRAISGMYCQVPGKPPSFMSRDKDAYGIPDPSLTFLPEPVDVRASCNGIVCCQSQKGDMRYYIVNPVTKQWKELPKPNADHRHDPAIVLIFEPSLLNFVADYKLVCAFPSADLDGAFEFEIYSSAEGSWRISGEILFCDWKLQPWSGFHVDGIVYWAGGYERLVAFDLENERSRLVYGMVMDFRMSPVTFGVMDGKLCRFSVSNKDIAVYVLSNPYANTTELTSNMEAWIEKCRIPLSNLELSMDVDRVLFAGGDVVVYMIGNELVGYDMKTKEREVFGSVQGYGMSFIQREVFGSVQGYGMSFIPYVNSLVYF